MRSIGAGRLIKQIKICFLGMVTITGLSACGGGGGGSSDDSAATTYKASGQVSGLQGSVKLTYNNQTVTLSQNGNFELPGSFNNNSDVQLSIAESPFTQACSLANPATRHVSSANITDINIACTALGHLTGRVSEYFTGTSIPGAQVSIMATSNGQQVPIAQVISDANGQFVVDGVGVSDRFVISARKSGYGEQAVIYSNTATMADLTGNITLLAAQVTSTFDATTANAIAINAVNVVSLPANALVLTGGTAPVGAVTASVTIIDASSDTSVMPGNYQARDVNGVVSQIESFGALSIQFFDSNGAPLQLAPGAMATISIPLSAGVTPASAPASIPLFYFDDATGYWVEQGSANLQQINGGYYYVGQVNHFTVWNADRTYETVSINGCVKDAAGAAVPFARVSSYGRTYIGSASVLTDIAGQFSVPARINSSVLVSTNTSSQSQTQIVATLNQPVPLADCLILAPDTATVKLTWGELPDDLDSHLYGPDGNSGQFHIYFAHQAQEVGSTVLALDVDDVTSFGPEIITIPAFPVAGTYSYYVNNYSGDSAGTILASPARVELNLNGIRTVFSPASASGAVSEDWHVFDIVVDNALQPTVVPIQQFVSGAPVIATPPPTVQSQSLRAVRLAAPRVADESKNILQQQVDKKYYAK